MLEIKSADAAELARIMTQSASVEPCNGDKNSVVVSSNNASAADSNSSASIGPTVKPYMRFYAGPVTQDSGQPGIRFDFNYGARVEVPAGDYRVRFLDREVYFAHSGAQRGIFDQFVVSNPFAWSKFSSQTNCHSSAGLVLQAAIIRMTAAPHIHFIPFLIRNYYFDSNSFLRFNASMK